MLSNSTKLSVIWIVNSVKIFGFDTHDMALETWFNVRIEQTKT